MGEGQSTEWPDDDADPFGTDDSETAPEDEAVETSEVSEEESHPEASDDDASNQPTDETPLATVEHDEWKLPIRAAPLLSLKHI